MILTNVLPVALDDQDLEQSIALYAYQAMITEVQLTPKPGLVDRDNTGAHSDMDIDTFIQSANSIFPFLKQFIQEGKKTCNEMPKTSFLALKRLGYQCECQMFTATSGINTHKGMIFACALLLGAMGRLIGLDLPLTTTNIQNQIRQLSVGLVNQDLTQITAKKGSLSAGEKLYIKYGVTGARGEAESGYDTLFSHSLPTYRYFKGVTDDDECALLMTLVSMMSKNQDTNLLSRGGITALQSVQNQATSLYDLFSSMFHPHKPKENLFVKRQLKHELKAWDSLLIHAHLSPGGSADLLAMTWFMDKVIID